MVRVRETENHGFLQWLTAFPLSDLRSFARRKAISSQFSFYSTSGCCCRYVTVRWGGVAASLAPRHLPLPGQ